MIKAATSTRIAPTLLLLSWASTLMAAPGADTWTFWDASDPDSEQIVDHSGWQLLLDLRLESLSDGRTILHYDRFSATDRNQLRDYLDSLTAIDPRSLNRTEQFAYWINLYNALTVDLMLDHPDKPSILRIGGGFLPTGPWDDDVTTIAGETLSLNDIEHRILRPIFQDHRIHFAVNCASVGCPNLASSAYTAGNLEAQLADGETRYLNHPRGLTLEDGQLTVSSIFKWYADDFGADREALLAYFASVRTDLADALTGYEGRIRYAYNWERNDH